MTFKVIGLDCATWKMIRPQLDELPNFKRLIKEGHSDEIKLDITPLSAVVWCSIFSGKSPEVHGHTDFVIDGKIQRREDIKTEFIWEVLDKIGYDAKALNIPFVYPPYNFKCEFTPNNFGLSLTSEELDEDATRLVERSLQLLDKGPDFFAVVLDQLDKIQHYHWGEPIVKDWYLKIDGFLDELIGPDDEVIIISDHGCTHEEKFTFSKRQNAQGAPPLKGFHDDKCILLTQNIDYNIKNIYDVFKSVEAAFIKI